MESHPLQDMNEDKESGLVRALINSHEFWGGYRIGASERAAVQHMPLDEVQEYLAQRSDEHRQRREEFDRTIPGQLIRGLVYLLVDFPDKAFSAVERKLGVSKDYNTWPPIL